jgi:ABC-type lipoprotein release transport system permease subunit
VVIVRGDQVVLFAVVVGISALASLIGIRKALRTDVGEVLS